MIRNCSMIYFYTTVSSISSHTILFQIKFNLYIMYNNFIRALTIIEKNINKISQMKRNQTEHCYLHSRPLKHTILAYSIHLIYSYFRDKILRKIELVLWRENSRNLWFLKIKIKRSLKISIQNLHSKTVCILAYGKSSIKAVQFVETSGSLN